METSTKAVLILCAEDDPEDRMLIKEAFKESRLVNELRFVEDGEALADYLHRRNEYSNPHKSPMPGLILLDLNMPKKNGLQALHEIRDGPKLRRIPVIALTTSQAEEDILRSYEGGLNSYITKPVTFDNFVKTVEHLGEYWSQLVELPPVLNGT